MKKINKFKKETPVTKTMEPKKGSVGEFIEVLKQFPADADFALDGKVSISGVINNEDRTVDIKPISTLPVEAEPLLPAYEDECCDGCCDECESYENSIMNKHLFGASEVSDEFMRSFRNTYTDRLIDASVMNPTTAELAFEKNSLYPNQNAMIDEIRHHNMFVAECMSEMYRRQITALLEYNTQCIAHFAANTNKCMCEIVNGVSSDEF